MIKFEEMPAKERKLVIDTNHQFKRVSRWIPIKTNYKPNKWNGLWDYVRDENGYGPYNDNFNIETSELRYFTWNNRKWAFEQFLAIGGIADVLGRRLGYIENNELHFLSGIDGEDIYNPIYLELSCDGEYVRVYKEVKSI